MKVTLNKTDDVNGIIAIEIDKTDYQDGVKKALSTYRQKAQIPGFRPGKVPMGVVQKMYGQQVLIEEINQLVGKQLFDYIREEKLDILGEPLPNETEQKELNFDKDENFEFKFDIALAPEFDVTFGEDEELTYYNVKLEDELLEQQINAYKQNFGSYDSIERESEESDLIKGVITELENGEAKEEGIVVENGIIMPSYIKDEETRGRFTAINVGAEIVFNPQTAYDNHGAEIASLLGKTKEEVEEINSDFKFEVKEITRYKEAELNQELFDKVLGEGAVATEEEFKEKVADIVLTQIKPAADNLFIKEARELILEKMKDIVFPEAFLKRWLVTANEENTEEQIEEDFPKILDDLKFHLAKEKIAKGNDIKVEKEEVEAFAAEVAKAQFAQYGMNNLTGEMLDNYVQSLLGDENTHRNMYEQVIENKVREWIKENAKIKEEEILSKDLDQMLVDMDGTPEEDVAEAVAQEIADEVESEENSEE